MSNALEWNGNWAWSLPLIVVNTMYHVTGMAFINNRAVLASHLLGTKRNSLFVFALVMGVTTLLAILLHAVEAAIWAIVYWALGALPRQILHALLARCDDHLWPRTFLSRRALASHGHPRGSERDDSLRTDDCFSICHDLADLAALEPDRNSLVRNLVPDVGSIPPTIELYREFSSNGGAARATPFIDAVMARRVGGYQWQQYVL